MAPDGPNMVLLVAQGLRADAVGFAGNPDVRTPNLDAIARHGIVFSSLQADETETGSVATTLLGETATGTHLPTQLRDAGYQCLAAGDLATSAGFAHASTVDVDYRRWLAGAGKTDRAAAWAAGEAVEMPALYRKSLGAQRSNLDAAHYVTTWIGDQAVRCLRSPEAPYFLYVNFTKPGPPFDPPAPWDAAYDRKALQLPADFRPVPDAGLTEARYRKVLAHYYANISLVDQQVGRILATLTARGRTNNVVVFTSDGGDPLSAAALVPPAQGQVPQTLPAGAAPLAIAGIPGQRHGATDTKPVRRADLLPTLLEAAGLEPTAQCAGTSLTTRLCAPD